MVRPVLPMNTVSPVNKESLNKKQQLQTVKIGYFVSKEPNGLFFVSSNSIT